MLTSPALSYRERVPLADCTTLRLGGPAARMARARTAEEVTAGVRAADAAGEPLLVLGGGSNLVVSDDGFDGTVIGVETRGIAVSGTGGLVTVTVAAGENWDDFVGWAVSEQLAGVECLSGIPGLAGATPIQNVGAYGQEVAATITAVTVLDRVSAGGRPPGAPRGRVGGAVRTMDAGGLGFGYRTSVFKRTGMPRAAGAAGDQVSAAGATGRYVVLDVTFALARDPMSVPVRYPQLAAELGVAAGGRAPLADVRAAVLGLRRGKGMVLDPADPDTASAGSFFTNPVLTAGQLAELERAAAGRASGTAVPVFPAEDGKVKVPAAWLIEQAGFGKGYPGHGAARISSKHTLALTNRGGASTAELIGLAREVVAGVRAAFGVDLANEPVLVGVSL